MRYEKPRAERVKVIGGLTPVTHTVIVPDTFG
jgi:hypothetical protein